MNIITGSGNDTINPGRGRHTVDGGAGIDRLIIDYSIGETGYGMNFDFNQGKSGTASRSGPTYSTSDYIYFTNVEDFTITGTSKNDTIVTYSGNNIINTGAGNDSVTANTGFLNGGSGFDFLKLNLSSQTRDLNLSNLSNINISGLVSATNFEQFTITTGNGNDTVIQTGLVNGIVLRANDVISTGAGNDTINAGLGSDTVYGGDGFDHLILDYSVGDAGSGMLFGGGNQFGSASRTVNAQSLTRLDSINYTNIERFTVIGTSKDDKITGGSGNDIFNGGAGNDRIMGGAGGDILTGGAGVDTFEYASLSDSQLGNHDVIKDLAIGTDIIDGPRAFIASQIKKLGNVVSLTEAAIKQVLTPTSFESNGASTFTSGNRTFLAMNDRNAGFSAATDSLIEITGYTGRLSDLTIR